MTTREFRRLPVGALIRLTPSGGRKLDTTEDFMLCYWVVRGNNNRALLLDPARRVPEDAVLRKLIGPVPQPNLWSYRELRNVKAQRIG